MDKLKIEYVPIDSIKPYKNNPRKNDNAVDDVANSIKEFGFKVPIVIDNNNEIIAGHTRLKASQKLGLKEVPVIVADDLSEEQIKAFRLADNKVSEKAEWDFDLLDKELDGILNIDMSDFGFDLDIENDFDEENLDDERQKGKVNISIVLNNYDDYEIIKERIENLTDEVKGNLSIKMI